MTNANEKQVGGNHYKSDGVQHWDYCIVANVPNLEYAASKYVTRWRSKNGLQDLEKAVHYMEKRLESITHYRGCIRGARKVKHLFNQFLKDNKVPVEESVIIDTIMHWKSAVDIMTTISRLQTLIEKEREGEPTSAYVNQDR